MSAHTPGPWNVGMASLPPHKPAVIDAGGVMLVCTMDGLPTEGESMRANARLIAAAPDLLRACEAMIAWDDAERNAPAFDSDGGAHFRMRGQLCERAFNLARDAIAKARGEV